MPQLSLDEIAAKRSASFHDGVFYRAAKMPKSFNKDARSARFIMTDETKDSYGDIVRAKGCDLSRFEGNPIALLNHQRDLILGTWQDVSRVAKRIEGTVVLADEGTAPHVDMTFKLMEQGILRAASIGFIPKDYEMMADEDGYFMGIDFTEWEMTECSVVSVPANPSALAKAIKAGDKSALEFIEQVLDTYTRTEAGLIVSKESLEAIHKEGTGERTSIFVKKTDEKGEYILTELSHLPAADWDDVLKTVNAAHLRSEEFAPNGPKLRRALMEDELPIKITDTPEAVEKIGVRAAIEAFANTLKSLLVPTPVEPVYVEGSMERAKALREKLRQKESAQAE